MRLLLTVVLALAVLPPTESLAQQVSAVNATMFMVHRDSIVYRLETEHPGGINAQPWYGSSRRPLYRFGRKTVHPNSGRSCP